MYPTRTIREILIIVLIVGLLSSAFFIFENNNVQSAQAYSLQGNLDNVKQDTNQLRNAVMAASVQPTTLDVRVSAGADDAEQRLTDGFMYIDSSDLELTDDPGVTKANQTVGMRFTGVAIPQGATIVQAYLDFSVDETSNEITSLVFHGQAADTAPGFTTTTNDISSRPKTSAAINWNDIPAWNRVGVHVQSPDLSPLIQEIVSRSGWASGSSLVIIVDGSGRRVASAFESGVQTAALLHISYLPAETTTVSASPPPTSINTPLPPTSTNTPLPSTSTVNPLPPTATKVPLTTQSTSLDLQVSARNNDAEQRVGDGHMYITSSDLELVDDPVVNKGLQTVGMRFTGVNIPRRVTIVQAFLEFQVDEASSEPTTLVFRGEAADNAVEFSNITQNISSRPKTLAAMSWNDIPAWSTIGARQQTPDLSSVIQEIVDRPGWESGNSLVIIVDGTGRRVASAYESNPQAAAILHISYLSSGGAIPPASPSATPTSILQPPSPTRTPSSTAPPPAPSLTPLSTSQANVLDVKISTGNDDVEQRVTNGYMYLNSSDLELTNDPGVAQANQSIGIRFTGINIPRGATIVQANLEFHVDEATSEATSLIFRGEAVDNASAFTSTAYNVSTRAKTLAAVSWNDVASWSTIGDVAQTPDLAPIIQEIVSRPGWVPGNSLSIIIDGTGRRVASSFESGVQVAATLHVVYLPFVITTTPAPTSPNATPTAASPSPTPDKSATSTPMPPTPTRTPLPTPSPMPNSSPTPVGQSGNWRILFDDEFNASSLDASKWRTCFWWADVTCSIETNHELELYNPDDVFVQNGVLRLQAQRRDMVAWNGVTYHYSSGMVMTGGRSGKINPGFTFTYGYAEARVLVPAGKGLWPAFWMLPVSYNTRPEIDIMEILGDTVSQYHMNYHYVGGDSGSTWNGPDFSAGWHVLGLDWTPTSLVWYVDGIERWRYTDAAHISNEPEYLLLNLAVGGDWPGSPDGNTPFPSYFDIDYVRVWQR